MQYPLSTLHTLVQEQLHPRRLLKHPERCNPGHQTWQTAHRQAFRLRQSFMQQTVLAKDTAALTLFVQSCTAGAVSLANRLHRYQAALRAEDSLYGHIADLQEQYAVLEQQLLRFIQYLRRYFPVHFNNSQPLPHSYKKRRQDRLAARIAHLQSALPTTGVDDCLTAIVLAPLYQCTQESTAQPLTYGRLQYLQSLVQELQDGLHHITAADATAAITCCLIQNNFNQPAFVQYLFAQWQQQAAELPLPEAAEYWATRLRECTVMLHYGEEGLHPSMPPVRACLLAAIRQEIQHTGTIATQPAAPIVTTSLSVTQLAVLLRVGVQCGMIKCSNQSALFRQIASAVRTEKAAKLSAESLRIKYHTPERTAISIVKDCLLQMVSSLHKL